MGVFSSIRYPLAFGGASISGEGGGYGFGHISEEESIELLKYSYEKGIEVFDTAPIYGYGLSEIRMGKAFRQFREKVILISKSGVDWHSNRRVDMTNDPAVAERMLNESLQRLQTDYIDLYFVHWPNEHIDIRKPLEVLRKAQDAGKIKHIGLSNTYIGDLEKAREVATISVVQNEYNFFANQIEQELFGYLQEHQIDFMSYGTLDKGVLSGNINKKSTFDDVDLRKTAHYWKLKDQYDKIDAVERIKPFISEKGFSLLELAFAHNLRSKVVKTLIVGARNKSQVDGIFQAMSHLPDLSVIEDALKLSIKR